MSREEATAAEVPAAVPEGAVDDLYGLPLEEFSKARNELAAGLRSEGERAAADWVSGLAKPSTAAWAVNQVMRTQRKDARALLEAGERLRKAHEDAAAGNLTADELRDAVEGERAAVGRLSQAARGLVSKSGRGLSEAIFDRVAETLHAVAADSEVRSLASAGRLSRERRVTGTSAFAAAPAKARRRGGAGAAQLEKVREQLQRVQREAGELRSARVRAARATSDAEKALARAREDMRRTDSKVAQKEAEVEQLRRKLEGLK
jgi:hypothetical protein